MNKINVSTLTGKDKFLETCLSRFGSMNKNDYEVELMYLLLLNWGQDTSDHTISNRLQMPLTKVRRLRYEADLKHPKEKGYYNQAFLKILESGNFKSDGNFIQFCVTDKSLREHLSELLENEGSYFDSSFNSSIVRLTASDLLILIAKATDDKNLFEKVKKEIVLFGANQESKRKSFKEQWKEIVVAIGKDLIRQVVPNLSDIIFS